MSPDVDDEHTTTFVIVRYGHARRWGWEGKGKLEVRPLVLLTGVLLAFSYLLDDERRKHGRPPFRRQTASCLHARDEAEHGPTTSYSVIDCSNGGTTVKFTGVQVKHAR